MPLQAYTATELAWIAGSILMLGMSKGGFPVGAIALPVLVLVWPAQAGAARAAVAFMLPMLCCMDIVAMLFYRRHVAWRRLLPMLPGTVAGIVVASILFVSNESALIAVSDRVLKICIGTLGLLFVLYRATSRWILKRLAAAETPGPRKATVFGFAAGLTSTLAHAGGPVMQIYLLPQQLEKKTFVATSVGFFFILNLLKLIPFSLLGRFDAATLKLGLLLLPIIPVGVGAGYLLVRIMKPKHYIGFIYTVLFVTSVILILKAVAG